MKTLAIAIVAALCGCSDSPPTPLTRYKITALGTAGEPACVWTNATGFRFYDTGCYFKNSDGKNVTINGKYFSEEQ